MRRGGVVIGAAGLSLVLLIAGLWLVPGQLDWSRYRLGIAALASQQLGRPVHIGGAISLQVLPQPILTAMDITVDDTGGDGVGLHAQALRLRVALGPLVAGQVDARELTLQGADLRLPWPPPQGAMVRRPPWLSGLEARVEDSRLQVGEVVFTGIEATVATDPETGTLSVAGVGDAAMRRWQFTARLAQPGRDGSAGLDVSLDGQGKLRDTGGTFSGQIGENGALSGRVAGRGPDLSQLMPAPALPWRGDGRLTAAAGLAVADELALEIGGAPARGAVALRVQPQARLDVSIAAGRLDLDAWLPALLERNTGTLRSGIPTGIDLQAEAATLAGGTLRQLRGGFDLEAGGMLGLHDVTALLPGEAKLTLSGQMSTNPEARFDGPVRLEAPDLRATLRWLDRVLPAAAATLSPGVLRTADVTAHVVADAGQATITELRGTLDASAISGSAALRMGGRVGIVAGLTLDRLTLDPWLPAPLQLSMGFMQAVLSTLRTVDADLKLQVQKTAWGEVPLGSVSLELQSETSRVVLRRLDAQPFGARLSVSGQVGENGRLSDGRLEFTAAALDALRPMLDGLPGSNIWAKLLRGPGDLLMLAAGPIDMLAGRVTLAVGDLRLEARPVVSIPARRWAGPLTVHHPGAPRLLETLGMRGTAAWLGDGSLSLVGQVTATPGRITMETMTLAAGAMRGTGWIAREGPQLTGKLALETLPLPLLYPSSPEPLSLAWLRAWQAALRLEAEQVLVGLTPIMQDALADVTLRGGVLRLDGVTGRSAGGTVSGAIALDAAADPPSLTVHGEGAGLGLEGALFETPMDLVAGQASVKLDVTAVGYSAAALLATLTGQATVQMHDGVATGFDLRAAQAALTLPDARAALDGAREALLAGTTPFTTLDMPISIERGVMTTEAHLAGPSGEASLSGSLDVQGGSEDLRLILKPGSSAAPDLGVRLAGVVGAPIRTPELGRLARWLADQVPP